MLGMLHVLPIMRFLHLVLSLHNTRGCIPVWVWSGRCGCGGCVVCVGAWVRGVSVCACMYVPVCVCVCVCVCSVWWVCCSSLDPSPMCCSTSCRLAVVGASRL